ncbi:hypothetical protein B4903_20030 [Yersinia frederiksenii]|nr:hypothetical protein B4903_20030 [Yersinia frederiksenii]
MLTEFHFDEDFFSATDLNGPTAPLVNNTLLNFWFDRGCLLYPFSSVSKYQEWEKKIPAKFSKKWMTALTDGRTCDFSDNYQRMASFENMKQVAIKYGDLDVDLILVPNEFNALGLSVKKEIVREQNIEVSKINGLLNSKSYLKSIELSSKGIKADEDINTIWSERFCKVAKHSKVITIVDRYLGENLLKDLEIRGRKTAIDNFVRFLSQTGRKFSITIYTDCGEELSNTHNEVSNHFRLRMKNSPSYKSTLSTIRVVSCLSKNFAKYSHDRFLCFDSIVYEIGRGFDMFRGIKTRATTISAKNKSNSGFDYSVGELAGIYEWSEDY